ncbi:MAG: RT0821/Lpp0805 family surface protein [Pseudomonadales bacterium]
MNRESRTLKRLAVAGLALALCLPATSHAVWQWLRGAAATDFKEADWAMLKETAMHVLNELPDHEQANWSNPDTGNKGSVMALATFQYQGQKCRRAALRNITYRGRDDRSAYTLCQQADGDWLFVPESAIREAATGEHEDAAAEDAAGEDAAGGGTPDAVEAAAATDSGS